MIKKRKSVAIKKMSWELIALIVLVVFILALIIFISSNVPTKGELYPGS